MHNCVKRKAVIYEFYHVLLHGFQKLVADTTEHAARQNTYVIKTKALLMIKRKMESAVELAVGTETVTIYLQVLWCLYESMNVELRRGRTLERKLMEYEGC